MSREVREFITWLATLDDPANERDRRMTSLTRIEQRAKALAAALSAAGAQPAVTSDVVRMALDEVEPCNHTNHGGTCLDCTAKQIAASLTTAGAADDTPTPVAISGWREALAEAITVEAWSRARLRNSGQGEDNQARASGLFDAARIVREWQPTAGGAASGGDTPC